MKKRERRKMIDRVIAYILVFTMVIHPVPVYAQNVSAEISKDAEVFEGSENGEIVLTESVAEAESGMAGETENGTCAETEGISEGESETGTEGETETATEVETATGIETETVLETETETEAETETETESKNVEEIFEKGIIKIYNLKQLQAIGSERTVTDGDASEDTFGMGTEIIGEGRTVVYSADAVYELMNEIRLDNDTPWTLLEGFTGEFRGKGGSEDSTLYDEQTDTVYVYNNAQLQAIASEDAADRQVLSKDMLVSGFGKGDYIRIDGSITDVMEEGGEYLTYSDAHTYILSPDFSGEMSETVEKPEGQPVFQNGRIQIYNLKQLYAIGTNDAVTTGDAGEESFGTGEKMVFPEDGHKDGEGEAFGKAGETIRYSLDADYELVNDISLESGTLWTLPEGFTGSFSRTPQEDARLYDAETDTIYIYNNYQLLIASSENAEEEPVMSLDMIPEKIGMGQFLYADASSPEEPAEETADENTEEPADAVKPAEAAGELETKESLETAESTETAEDGEAGQGYLTYSGKHNYVLSMDFTEQMPELMANEYVQGTADDVQKGGRDYIGQQYMTIEGQKYILIGNEQQLRAIGSDKSVTPMLFLRTEAKFLGISLGAKIVPYYPGDADFNIGSFLDTGIRSHKDDIKEGTERFQYKWQNDEAKRKVLMDINWASDTLLEEVVGIVGGLLGNILGELLGERELVGFKLDKDNVPSIGADDGFLGTKKEYTTFHELRQEYKDLKYSSDANYIIFRDIDLLQGDYSNGEDDSWTPIHLSGKLEGRLNMNPAFSPTIKNVHVEQTGKLNMETTSGIGFFGTITNKLDEDTLGSAGTAVVKNIHLDHVSIRNESTEVDANVGSLVEGLLGLLGGLLGGLLDLLNPVIGNLKLGQVIEALLTLKQKSPDLFATGSFAGRIVGDVHIENCVVSDASVTSARGISGGFVGFTEGVEKYDALSGILKGVVKVLSIVLNIVPGVGLGDLITILLENDVDLGALIPIGYHNPVITGCKVTLRDGTIGNVMQDYNGGFVGIQTGTKISDCSVAGLTSVQAKNGAGGFAGLERDAIIKGLLNDAGITLYEIDAKSGQVNCIVDSQGLTVEAAESYAGGFNGAMANSISTGSVVRGVQSVAANKYAGGFAGRATIGFGTTLGGEDEKKPTLVDSVSKLLEKVLASGSEAEKNQLLTLAGVMPSKLHGCTVEGNNLTVESTDAYAGGMIGQGDGVKITPVGPAAENTAADGEKNAVGNAKETAAFKGKITGLQQVKAGKYAGGVAGSVVTADVIGVLNNTLGVGQFIPFELSQISVEGTDWSVTATEKYAAGACGLMLGGMADTVTVNGLKSIQAGNYTGGFAGRTGASGLASAGGLDVLGLVKLNNVLSLADGNPGYHKEQRGYGRWQRTDDSL